jgi:hypothetical protein
MFMTDGILLCQLICKLGCLAVKVYEFISHMYSFHSILVDWEITDLTIYTVRPQL